MEETISGEEKCLENKSLRRAGIPEILPFALATGASAAGASEGPRFERFSQGKLRVEWAAPDSIPSHFLYRADWVAPDEAVAGPALANQDKLQDCNNCPRRCQNERIAW